MSDSYAFYFSCLARNVNGISRPEVSWHFHNGAVPISRTKTDLPSSMSQSYPWIWDPSVGTTTTGTARESYISIIREMGSGIIDVLR